MEQRGSGFARMRDAMLNHGLDAPKLSQEDGYFVVTLPGPAGNYDRLTVPAGVTGPITPAVVEQLNERQRDMVRRLSSGEVLTSRECRKLYALSPQAVYKDFQKLIELGIADQMGSGRTTRYVLHSLG